MTILFAAWEDIHFPNGDAVTYQVGSYYRSDWSRSGLSAASGGMLKSLVFDGGEITDGWLSSQITVAFVTAITTPRILGFGKSGTNKGIFIGTDNTGPPAKLTVSKYDGSTNTVLATSSSAIVNHYVIHKYDINLINYGATGQVIVYQDGIEVLNYSGDISISGVTGFDSVFFGQSSDTGSELAAGSEFIVSTTSTRTMNLCTLTPNGAGDTNDWTGAYTDVDELTISDVDVIYAGSNNLDFQCALSNLPAGSYSVKGVAVAARCQKDPDSTPTHLKLGVKTNSSINVDAGHDVGDLVWGVATRIMETNPVTSSVFNTAEIDALQLDLRTAA